MLLAYGVGLLFVGFILLLASIRFRRRGVGRRCRTCDYDLAGIDTEDARCPECGTRLNPLTIIDTDRADILHRARPIFRIVGVLAAITGIGLLLVVLYRWPGRYEHTPSWFLVNVDLPAAMSSENQLVMDELIRRRANGELSDSDAVAAGQIIIDGIPELVPAQFLINGSFGNHFLHPLIEAKLITAEDLAGSQALAGSVEIDIREPVEAGKVNSVITWESSNIFVLPAVKGMPQVSLERTEILIDGNPISNKTIRPYGFSDAIISTHEIRTLSNYRGDVEPGKHTLTIRGNILWFNVPDLDAPVVARTPYEDTVSFTVLAEDLPDPQFLHDREKVKSLEDALNAHSYIHNGRAIILSEQLLDDNVVLMFDAQVKVGGQLAGFLSSHIVQGQ